MIRTKPISHLLTPDVVELFNSKVVKSGGVDACWIWLGAPSPYGYGRLSIGGSMYRAHRVALTIVLGRDIEPGLIAGHECHDRAAAAGECNNWDACKHRLCVNPRHLAEQTNAENTLASANTLPAIHAAKTNCPAGHALIAGNLVASKLRHGGRTCLTCKIENDRERNSLISKAARLLGLTISAYTAIHGWSKAVALEIIDRIESGAEWLTPFPEMSM